MSHSKTTKRGRSYYLETLNPSAKRFMVKCITCGHTGFKPEVLDRGFATTFELKAIRRHLYKVLKPLKLNEHGQCVVCDNTGNGP